MTTLVIVDPALSYSPGHLHSSNGVEVPLPFEEGLEALVALHRRFVSHKKLEESLAGAERVTLDVIHSIMR